MVVISLFVKADLENVARVEFPDQWSVVVQQTNGDERREVIIDPDNEEEITGSRGTCNFKLKWPGAKKESYLNVIKEPKGGQTFLGGDRAGDYVAVVAFDCRGLEPVEWNIKDGSFRVVSEGGKTFDDVTFEEEDWYDYDDDADQSVGVTNLEFKFERS